MKLFRFTLMFCVLILAFSTQAFAATTINEDFENTTVAEILGSGKLFEPNTTISAENLSIEAEDMGSYVNNYLRLKPGSEQRILLTNSGVLNDDVTIISAKMKFEGGNTTGFIIRNGSNYVYLAVNNGGGDQLRLFNNYNTRLTINNHSKWYDLYYVIDFTKNQIYGKITQSDDSSVYVESTVNIEENSSMQASIKPDSHFRLMSTADAATPSNGMCIDEFMVSDKYEPDYFVNENFDRHKEGKISDILFAPISGLRVQQRDIDYVSVEKLEEGKCIKVEGTANIAEPLVYTSTVPSGRSVLSFDLKGSDDSYEFRAFVQTNSSNRLNIMQYSRASVVSTNADFVSVLGQTDAKLGEKIKNEFVHFTFVIDKGEGITTVTGYANGKYFGTKTLGVEYTSIRFDLNAGNIAPAENRNKTVMYLDNYQIYQPGEAKLGLGVRDYVLNGDYITLNANNVIDPQTLSFTCSDGVTVTPETDDGKIYRLVLGGIEKNREYQLTTGEIYDIYGQKFPSETLTFKSVSAEDVETDISYKIDGVPCLNGKFAPGEMELTFNAFSNTNTDNVLKVFAALYNKDERCISVSLMEDITLPARMSATDNDSITIPADCTKIKVFVWKDDITPVCAVREIVPYTYDEIESVVPLYPGYTNKAVTFSYDDGTYGTDAILIELMNRYNIKSTFNIVGKNVPETQAERQEYVDLYAGHEVANHSQTHPMINVESSGVTIAAATEDILNCTATLENAFGDNFDTTKWGFIWPYARPAGRLPETDIPFVTELEQNIINEGVVYIRPVSTTGGFDLPQNWMLWEPTSKDDYMEKYTDEFLADTEEGLRLLFLWGHSTDLYNKRYGMGFADLEATLKKLTAEDVNIWSATNMQIYDYIHAVEGLEVSEDKTKIYNSSDVDVYAVINGQRIVIPAKGYTAL